MDWRQVTREIESLEGLSPAERADRLEAVIASDQDQGAFITGYFERRRRLASFMQTSDTSADEERFELLPPGAKIGIWRIQDFVAAGGMGEVYAATRADGLYDQRVALKVLSVGSGDWRERFDVERQRLASMDHPGISRIIDGGESAEGRPYMAIEFVDGVPIDTWIENHQPALRRRLMLFMALCAAVGHAHGKLILHRDLKPSNILVDDSGHVRLIDFGVSSLIEGDSWGGLGPMTIAYAAPEQLAGESPSVASDVFALGMVFHTMLLGAVPEREPKGSVTVDTRRLRHPDLAAILTKATAFDAAHRYNSAAALAADVGAVLDRRPVAARQGGRFYAIGKSMQRYPLAWGLASVLFVALSAGLAGSLVLTKRATEARDRAEFFLEQAESSSALEATYADILDRVFTTEEDSARIREVMLQRATQAYEHRDEDPNAAAEIAMVVGGHFLQAYDYETSRKVLEPWLAEGYGHPDHVRTGRIYLADAASAMGDTLVALEQLRTIRPSFDNPYRRYSNEHIKFVFELAYSSDLDEDEAHALEVISEAVDADDGADPERLLRMLYYQQYLYKERGQFELAYSTLKRAAALYGENPLLEQGTWGTITIFLAGFELFFNRNYDAAETLADAVIAWGEQNGSPDDQAYRFKAVVRAINGEFDTAKLLIERAGAIESQYLGNDDFSQYLMIEVLTMEGDYAGAQSIVDRYVRADSTPNLLSGYHARLVLAAAYLVASRDGPEAAASLVRDFGLGVDRITTDPGRRYRYERLLEMGVPLPEV